jgi:hypothetical protein
LSQALAARGFTRVTDAVGYAHPPADVRRADLADQGARAAHDSSSPLVTDDDPDPDW